MEIKSKKVTVQKSAEAICNYLCDVKNFEQLMPDNISKFEVIREDAFVFALKGMPEIALEVKEVVAPYKVTLGAISDKIPFTLISHIDVGDKDTSAVELQFEGKFNTMMSMMIKGPLTKFIDTLTTNLEKL
ncbi:SRPBCC family protein [Patiriisocius sp. Uisw_017]|jgi:carbon monoxide dehydrogenase subunit G|uniref:SRPBCC family protein n=1 Tax=Patiriisocius sp. Uisw_017 TaxID=3230968 RepID=UPI0039E94699